MLILPKNLALIPLAIYETDKSLRAKVPPDLCNRVAFAIINAKTRDLMLSCANLANMF